MLSIQDQKFVRIYLRTPSMKMNIRGQLFELQNKTIFDTHMGSKSNGKASWILKGIDTLFDTCLQLF